jgi:hypothetical protein
MRTMPARFSPLAFSSLLALATGTAALAAACGSGGGGSTFVEPIVDAAPDPGIDAAFVTDDDAGAALRTPRILELRYAARADAGLADCTAASSPQTGQCTLEPARAGQTLQLEAYERGQSAPLTGVLWYVDPPSAATVDANGKLTITGAVAGQVRVFGEIVNGLGQASLDLRLVARDGEGSIDATARARLDQAAATIAGGGTVTADPAFTFLYPYDETVFARGLQPPTLQFGGAAPVAYLLRAIVKNTRTGVTPLVFEGYYPGSNPGRIRMGAARWKTITESAGAGDTVTVEVYKADATRAYAPVRETWTVAPGSLRGSVYYNSYDSRIAQLTAGGSGGAILKVRPSSAQPELLVGGGGGSAGSPSCTVCHSVSANGSVLALSNGHVDDRSYELSPTAAPRLRSRATRYRYGFGALSPDGKWLVSSAGVSNIANGIEGCGAGTWRGNVASVREQFDSELIDTTTGQPVPTPSFSTNVRQAIMPSFSPDGKRIAFNYFDAPQGGRGRSLAVMDTDVTVSPATFRNLRTLVRKDDAFLGWPAFVPSGGAVLFQNGTSDDYSTWCDENGFLQIADVSTGVDLQLRRLNGWKRVGTGWQPYLASEVETRLNFEPTVLPVAVGGYYWAVFTSRRQLGNTLTNPDATDPSRKKLWVAAIDIKGRYDADPSHPAFYLEGQEVESGNLRGFWSLDACKPLGQSCESGADCCDGRCRPVVRNGQVVNECSQPSDCARTEERCRTTTDCCDSTQTCINGFCSVAEIR